jgi:hypothetical protein
MNHNQSLRTSNISFRAEGIAQVIEDLLSKCEVMSSNPSMYVILSKRDNFINDLLGTNYYASHLIDITSFLFYNTLHYGHLQTS